MNRKQYYTYIISNYTRTVLYVGITDNLVKRIWQHKQHIADGFTKKYKVHDLIFYEIHDEPGNAITREKQIKSWSREHKEQLIDTLNPKRRDLYEDITA